MTMSNSSTMASPTPRLPPPPPPTPPTSYIRKRTHSFSVSHFAPTLPPAHLRAATSSSSSSQQPGPQSTAPLTPSRPGLQRRHAIYDQSQSHQSLSQTSRMTEDSHMRKDDVNERPAKRVAKEPRTSIQQPQQSASSATSSSSSASSSKPRWSLWSTGSSRSIGNNSSSSTSSRVEGSGLKRSALGFGRSRLSRSRSPSPSGSTKTPVLASTEPTLGRGTPSSLSGGASFWKASASPPYRPSKLTSSSGSRIQEHLEDVIIEEDEEEEDDDEPSRPPGLPLHFPSPSSMDQDNDDDEEDDNKRMDTSSDKPRYSRGGTPEPEDIQSNTPVTAPSKPRSPSPTPPPAGSPRFSSPLGPIRRILPPRPHMPRKPSKSTTIRFGASGIRVESLGEKGSAADMYRRVMVRNAKVVWRSVCERKRREMSSSSSSSMEDEEYVLMVAEEEEEVDEEVDKRRRSTGGDEMDVDQGESSLPIDIDSLPDIPDLELEAYEQPTPFPRLSSSSYASHSSSSPTTTQGNSIDTDIKDSTSQEQQQQTSSPLVVTIQLPSSTKPLSTKESQQIAIAQEALLLLASRPVELRHQSYCHHQQQQHQFDEYGVKTAIEC